MQGDRLHSLHRISKLLIQFITDLTLVLLERLLFMVARLFLAAIMDAIVMGTGRIVVVAAID